MAKDIIPELRAVVTRAEAKAKGLKRYFTGKACKRGHVAERIAATGFCLECRRAWDRKWQADNPAKAQAKAQRRWRFYKTEMRAYAIEWHKRNPDANRKSCKRHYWKNPDQARLRGREWKNANKRVHLDSVIEWQRRNPRKLREYLRKSKHARRAAARNAGGTFTSKDIKRIFEAQRGKCAYCRTCLASGHHIDHIIALKNGGTNWPSNLQLCCGPCNKRKQAKDPIDFARSFGFLL